MSRTESWGRVPRAAEQTTLPVTWRDEVAFPRDPRPVLPRGLGRSYGDSCLNDGGYLLDTSRLSRLIRLDPVGGLLRCEAGASFDDILGVIVPAGFFFPVTPGTRFVTVGGAVANDVHGKNHHVAGCFGAHVTRLELVRSSGERLTCSRDENEALFAATIGGLGLTGLVTWVEFRLRRIESPLVEVQEIRFGSVDEFHDLNAESEREWEHTVAWVDTLAGGRSTGRGIYLRGRHAPAGGERLADFSRPAQLPAVPFDAPASLLCPLTMRLFNAAWFRLKGRRAGTRLAPIGPFFYPLDVLPGWNRLYGRRGFYQYQCVLSGEGVRDATRELLELIARSGQGSFLSVLKTFGGLRSPGMLSFPRPGITLALDFANQGEETSRLFDALDAVVFRTGGALYPAKDARMPPRAFEASYPGWREFAQWVDPAFSSSFWRRVTRPNGGVS